jgi:hypothetical protein
MGIAGKLLKNNENSSNGKMETKIDKIEKMMINFRVYVYFAQQKR